MPNNINITKHRNWSQLFQCRCGQRNRCIMGSECSQKCATRAENICIMYPCNFSAYLQIYMVSHSKRNHSNLKPSQYLDSVNVFGLATVSGVWLASTWTFQELLLFSSGKLNTLDVSRCHIHTCPKPWLIVGCKPMRACGWSQVLVLLLQNVNQEAEPYSAETLGWEYSFKGTGNTWSAG